MSPVCLSPQVSASQTFILCSCLCLVLKDSCSLITSKCLLHFQVYMKWALYKDVTIFRIFLNECSEK